MQDELHDDPGAEGRYRALGNANREERLTALYDASWRVRRLAAELVARDHPDEALVHRLIAVLSDRGQTGARNAAVTALSQAGPVALPALLALLAHPDPDQRKLAADVLGVRRETGAFDALTRALNDADPNVQGAAAEALGCLGGAKAAHAVAKLLGSPQPLVRACALEALFALRWAPPLTELVPLLPARGAFRLLGLVTHPSAVAVVCRALESDATRDAALAALGIDERPWPQDAEAQLRASLRAGPDVEVWLRRALKAEDRAVRIGAMHAVAALKAAALAPAVADAAGDGDAAEQASRTLTRLGLFGALALIQADEPPILAMGPEARAVASEAVVRVGEPALVPHLQRLMQSGDAELAEVATRALGRCRTPQAIAPLLEALTDDALASAASRALGRLGASFRAEVVWALGAVPMKPHVLRALVQVDPQVARAAVRNAANDGDAALRAAAAEAANILAPSDAVEALGVALTDEAPMVRRAAVRALTRSGRGPAAPLLARALRDRDASVLAAACDAAAELKVPAVAARVAELTAATEGFVVLAALQALASLAALDEAKAVAALTHLDAEVVKAALALTAERPMARAHAERLLFHPRWDVRAAAARALEVTANADVVPRLREAIARETDAMAREILEGVASRLAER